MPRIRCSIARHSAVNCSDELTLNDFLIHDLWTDRHPGERYRSSPLYRRTRRIAADLTRPLRRIELALVFRQDLSEPVKILDAKVQIELTQASRDDVEQAASLNPSGSRRETFWWRLENDCLCFVARAASEIVAYNWVRLRPDPMTAI